MKKRISNIVTIIFLALFLSCKTNNVEGIKIERLLIEKQSLSENKEMTRLIKLSLLKDKNAFRDILYIPNVSDGESAYIHGFTIYQIIHNLDEDNVIKMISEFDIKSLRILKSYISAGFDYSDNQFDNFKNEFPKLYKILNEKTEK
jgi:hypothetical protein